MGRLPDAARARLRGRVLGFVFQSYNRLPRLTALEPVELPLVYQEAPNGRRRAAEALMRVGLGPRIHHRPSEMTGGEQQRVAIARMLIQEPKVILADEPIASLDVIMRVQIMDLIRDIAVRDGLTVVMSLHQLDVAKTYADRIIALAQGQVTFDGPPNELSDAVIERVFKKPVDEVDEDQTVEIAEASVE